MVQIFPFDVCEDIFIDVYNRTWDKLPFVHMRIYDVHDSLSGSQRKLVKPRKDAKYLILVHKYSMVAARHFTETFQMDEQVVRVVYHSI